EPTAGGRTEARGWSRHTARGQAGARRSSTERLDGCRKGECSPELVPSIADSHELQTRITAGDACATSLGFASIKLLDGGELEDVMRTLATLSEHHPALLLKMFEQRQFSASRIGDLICM